MRRLLCVIFLLCVWGCESRDKTGWTHLKDGSGKARQYELNDHAYIEFEFKEKERTEYGVCHDPDCIKCKQIRKKELEEAMKLLEKTP